MSRGLGELQRMVKRILAGSFELGYGALRFADLRRTVAIPYGGYLPPTYERSLKRALKGLVDRGDVLIVSGSGGPGDPRRYTTVECFASLADETVKDTAHAKQIVAKLQADAAAALRAFE